MIRIIGQENRNRHIFECEIEVEWSPTKVKKSWKPIEGAGDLFPNLPEVHEPKETLKVARSLCGKTPGGLDYPITEQQLKKFLRTQEPKICTRCVELRTKRQKAAKVSQVISQI